MAVKKLVSIAIAAIAGQLVAGTYTWTGAAGDGLYFTAGNWSYDDGAGNVTTPAANAPSAAPTDDVTIAGNTTVSYIPGGNWSPKGLVTVRDGATLIQPQNTNYAYLNGGMLLDGGTYDTGTSTLFTLSSDLVVTNGGTFLLRTSMATESTGSLILEEGTTFRYFKNAQWNGTAHLILHGGTAVLGDGVSVTVKGKTTDQLIAGKLIVSNQYHPTEGQVFDGDVTLECAKFAVQSKGLVHPWRSGRLVCTGTSDNGYYQNNGSYIDVPAGSTAVFTFNIPAVDVYKLTFGSNKTTPKFRYNGEVLSETDFNRLFTVQASSDYEGLVDFYLTPVSDDAPSFADNSVSASLVSPTEAILTAVVSNPGTPSAGLVAMWGLADCGHEIASWDNILDLGTAAAGALQATLSLTPNRRYFYRLAATNSVGEAWASPNPASFISTIIPLAPTNTWIGAVSSDSREPGNWSLNHVPTASETVFVLDLLAQNQLDWWPGTGTDTVAGWLQPEDGFEDAKWAVTFHMTPDSALSVAGDVLLGAGIWTHEGPSATPTNAVNVSAGGDFTLGAQAKIYAGNGATNDEAGRARGYYNAGPGYTDGLAGASYAGDGGSTSVVSFVSYGSILNPCAYGSSGLGDNLGFSGAGVILLRAGGAMTVDGTVAAIGHGWNGNTGKGASTGGSINITAGELLGTGSISANGGQDTAVGSGSGGRIAVRLTGSGADFSNAPTMTANGRGGSASGATSSAAGTIYLQTASDQEGSGTVRVSNPNNLVTLQDEAIPPAATHLPAKQDGDSMPVLKKTKWELSGRGAIRLTRDVQIASLSLAADDGTQTVYTDGFKLTTHALNVNGFNLRGVYTKDNAAWVKGEGSVTVGGSGLVVFIR